MSTELDPNENSEQIEQAADPQPAQKTVTNHQDGSSGAVYALGLFGAWIFYIGRANSISEGIMGFMKGFVWPAILVYKLFVFFSEDAA